MRVLGRLGLAGGPCLRRAVSCWGSAAARPQHQLIGCSAGLGLTVLYTLGCPAPVPAGVTIAATGGKDRVVRLWGLAPLVPSPVQKPQIATLRVSRGCLTGGRAGLPHYYAGVWH